MSRLHIADTGLFVAMGQPSNSRYQAVRQFARRNDVTFVLPERVYEELTVDESDVEAPPIDTAIDEGGGHTRKPTAARLPRPGETPSRCPLIRCSHEEPAARLVPAVLAWPGTTEAAAPVRRPTHDPWYTG